MTVLFRKSLVAVIATTLVALSNPAFAIQKYQSRGISSYQSHSIAPRSNNSVKQYNSRNVARYSGGGVQKYQSHSVHALTNAERARMIRNDKKAGHALAQQWTRGTGRLNQDQLNAIRQMSTH